MPSLEDLITCVCTGLPSRPNVQEVIDVLRTQGVCIGNQCYQTLQDAIPMQVADQNVQEEWAWAVVVIVAIAAATRLRMGRPLCNDKFTSSRPPPPPPPPAVQ